MHGCWKEFRKISTVTLHQCLAVVNFGNICSAVQSKLCSTKPMIQTENKVSVWNTRNLCRVIQENNEACYLRIGTVWLTYRRQNYLVWKVVRMVPTWQSPWFQAPDQWVQLWAHTSHLCHTKHSHSTLQDWYQVDYICVLLSVLIYFFIYLHTFSYIFHITPPKVNAMQFRMYTIKYNLVYLFITIRK